MPRVQDYKDTSEEASSSKEMIVFYLANTFINKNGCGVGMASIFSAAPARPTDLHLRVTGNQVFLLDGLKYL